MRKSLIGRIREAIRLRRYDMTIHAMEEMAEDGLDVLDIEHAVLSGRVSRTERGDPRGNRFVVVGAALDQEALVGVVGRFTTTGRYLIITVYDCSEEQ